MPDVCCPNLFVTRRFVPGVLKRVGVRYFGLGLRLVLVLGPELEMPGVQYETPGYESQGAKCVETLRS